MQKKTIMYAYEYGIRNFDKKYQPFPNITVFNDKIEILDENNTATSGFGIYQEITLLEDTNKAELKESGTIYPAIVVEDYLIPQEVFLNTEEQKRVDQLNREFDVFLFETKFFIHIPESNVLDEVVITAQGIGRKTKFPPRLTELNDELNQKKTSIVLFISNDGVKLERAYQKTTDILDNEIVLFIEKNDTYNLFGSVIRIRSGNSISQNADLPFKDITKLARVYDLDVSSGAVLEVLQDHLQDKSSNFYFIRKALLWGSRVSKVPVNFALGKIADAMDEVSQAIENNLKIGDNYYKAYDQEGNISKTYTPILPGFNLIQTVDKANENTDNEQVFIQFTKILNALEAQIQRGVDALQIDSLKKYIKRRLRVLFDVIKEAKGFIKDIIGQAIEFIKTSFVFINAFLVGIINSLVDVVKGIFDIISLICKAVVGLNNVQQNTLENPSSQFSLFMEMFENALETTVKLFTLKNIKATFVFIGKLFVRFITSPPSINITGDSLGYGIGYLIGFIVEEVVFGILTGGAKTVGTALQLAIKSYTTLAKGAYKAVRKTVTMSVDTFLSFIAFIRKKLEDFPKMLKDLEKWLNDVLQVGKKLDAYAQFTRGLIKALDDLGIDIARILINGTDKAVVTQYGNVIYEGSFQNFFNALTDFNKKIGVDRNKLKRRLDEIASGLNEEMLSILKKKKLKVERKSRATKTLDVVDNAGNIVFRGIPEDIPKFLDFINKPLAERRKLISVMQEGLRGKTTKYNPTKTLDKGYDIPVSKSGTSPDFDGLTEYLYQGNAKFGKVKIKITGSRDADFSQANKLMGLDEIPEGFTWHHLDDLDENLEGILQLVKSTIHTATYKHFGSAKQLQELLDIKKYL